MKAKTLIALLALIFNGGVSGFGEEVPKELLKPGVGLELIEGTKHELLRKIDVGETSYFVVLQNPEFGPGELVLIKQDPAKEPQFVRGGTWADITRAVAKDPESREQPIPEVAMYAVASVLVMREIDSRSVASLHSANESGKAMARLAQRVKEEDQGGHLDRYLKKAYQDQGLIK